MANFIEQSAEDIMLSSMANVFMPEALDPVGKEDDDIDNDGDVDKSDGYLKKRRKTVGAAIAADKAKRTKKEELELHLRTKVGELAEKKLYKSEKATNSDEKEVTIEEKPVKNKVVINPDVNEGLINTVKNFYEVVGDTRSRSNKSPVKTGATPSSSSSALHCGGAPASGTSRSSSGPTKFTSKPEAMKCSGVVTSTAFATFSLGPKTAASSGRNTTPPSSFGAYSLFISSSPIT